MTLEARRKNQGKQYTVVCPQDKVIRHWHRPGDHLPKIITHAGTDYLLTAEVVDQARVHKRSKLLVLSVDANGTKLIPAPTKLRQLFGNPVARTEVARCGSFLEIHEEIDWKAVGLVVTGLFAVAAFATFLTVF